VKRILLVGAGHAHLVVLRALAQKALYGARVMLVSPEPLQVYSGMLPGVLAGHYALEETQTPLARLAALAYAEFTRGTVEALDLANRIARLDDGTELRFDVLSLNVGSRMSHSIDGALQHALAIRPFDDFLNRLHGERVARVAVVGAGAAGLEVAMALRFRGAAVTLYSERASVHPMLAERAERALRRLGVDFRPGMPVHAIQEGPTVVAGAATQEFDVVPLATGAAAAPLMRHAGLQCDEDGFALVDASLRSVSHPDVFASGDCATLQEAPHPKSGVYSVRHGEILHQNLRRLMHEQPLAAYRPQAKTLTLLTCGARYAIAQRGDWSAEGAWAWHWKNRIDRKWLRSLEGR
jgi:pyridine nucleotide-disulfide oxidoreductase family protein